MNEQELYTRTTGRCISAFRNLREVSVHQRLADLSCFSGLSSLRTINLCGVSVSGSSLYQISKIQNLEVLKLGNCLDAMHLDASFSYLTSLRLKKLRMSHVNDMTMVGFSSICQITTLEELELDSCPRVTDPGHTLSNLVNLTLLRLTNCLLLGNDVLASVSALVNLDQLALGNCGVSSSLRGLFGLP